MAGNLRQPRDAAPSDQCDTEGSVNRSGHPTTLVAAQPGNSNALKAGVYSPRALAARAGELEDRIAGMPAEELAEKVWRHEVASLMALTEAIDNSLTQQGLVGRSGEARTLVPYRLRANEKLRKTLHDLRTIQTEGLRSPAEDDRGDKPERNRPPNIPIALAETYERTSVEQIGPEEFDPETFLVTIIETNDPGTRTQD